MTPRLMPQRHSRQLILLLAMWSVNFLITAWFFIVRDLLQGLCWAFSVWALMGMTRSFMLMLDITQDMGDHLMKIVDEAISRKQGETESEQA